MREYQVLDEVQRNLAEIDHRYKQLMWDRFLATILVLFALVLAFGGLGFLLWYIWELV